MGILSFFADYVEVNTFDMLKDPRVPTYKILDYIFFKVKTICGECHDYKTFKLKKDRQKGDCFTIKCKCGVSIIYPEHKSRDGCRLWVTIPKEKYENRKENGV